MNSYAATSGGEVGGVLFGDIAKLAHIFCLAGHYFLCIHGMLVHLDFNVAT